MKHYHKNPRQITKKQMSDLQKWLVEFGDLSGIVHNIPTDEIIGGNQRSEALPGVLSGLVQPIITERFDEPLADGTVCRGYYDIDGRQYAYRGVNWDDKKAERANLIANKAGGTFDMDILANQFDLPVLLDSGFEERELIGFDFGEPKDAEPQTDRAAELLEKWGVVSGDMFQIGNHRLICGDCTDPAVVARVMGGEKAGACVTDSPYGINREGIENDDPEGLRELFDGCLAAMPIDNGAIINFQSPRLYPIWLDAIKQAKHKHERALWMYDENDQTKPWHYWLMCSQIAIITSVGKPEWLEAKAHHDCYVIGLSREWRAGGDGNDFAHASVKPVGVVQDIMAHVGGDVYDPFTGSGTSLVACENLGRRGRGIEISPAYCAVTLERLATAFPHLEITRIENDPQN